MYKIAIRTIKTESLSELDFELYNELFGKEMVDQIYEDVGDVGSFIIDKRNNFSDGFPVNIDKLMNILSSFKKIGCNYIALDYHCDHIGYELEGIKIENANNDEIEDEQKALEKRKQKQDKINDLYKQIQKLNNT